MERDGREGTQTDREIVKQADRPTERERKGHEHGRQELDNNTSRPTWIRRRRVFISDGDVLHFSEYPETVKVGRTL